MGIPIGVRRAADVPVLYFPHGTPTWWPFTSRAATPLEQTASSWGFVRKLYDNSGAVFYWVVP